METGIWDYEFLSKREIHNTLREVAGSYGACMAVDKESAVHRCMDALTMLPAANVAPIVRCRDCEHFGHLIAGEKHSCKNYQLPYCKPDDFCSYGKVKKT